MNQVSKYTVSIWNTEFIDAVDKGHAKEIIKSNLHDRIYQDRDFEYDDAQPAEDEDYLLSNWESWNNFKNNKLMSLPPTVDVASRVGELKRYKVMMITTERVRARSTEEAEQNAFEMFHWIDKESFEINAEEWEH